ncbi:hypothetical protein GCM10009535_34180 [Streptomyces thermocarboxydovorans]|uniref:Uncharacterized protein n=1 Tax=Streptomyces thermocarboxydovorans TaxID=59298 RepID=A0ABP3SMM6_9ACTN
MLGPVDGAGGLADPGRCDGDEQVADGGLVAYGADELAHHAEAAADGDRSGVRFQLAGQEAEQGGLARSVRSDQGHDGALADPEGDIAQERPPVGEVVLQVCCFQMAHGSRLSEPPDRGSNDLPGRTVAAGRHAG